MNIATTQFSPAPNSALERSLRWPFPIWVVWILLMVLGGIGVVQRVTQGHLPAGYGSYVPWGLWIAIYFHAVGIAAGAFLVGALGYLAGVRGLATLSMLRTVIVLSIAAMVPAFLAVWFDLGRMDRGWRILTSPSFSSMMAFNAWMYIVFVLVAATAWVLSFRNESTWLKPVLALGAFFACLIPSQSGAFFGVVDAKPFWNSALLPILFLASAVTSGAATLIVVRAATRHGLHDTAIDRLRAVMLTGIGLYLVLEFAEFSIHLWNPTTHSPAVDLILTGPYWWVFWFVHLGAGVVLPLALMLLTARKGLWVLAALLVAVTMLTTRLNVLVPGQAVPELKGLQEAFNHPRLDYTYHATLMEYLVGFFLVAVGMAAFVVVRQLGNAVGMRLARAGATQER